MTHPAIPPPVSKPGLPWPAPANPHRWGGRAAAVGFGTTASSQGYDHWGQTPPAGNANKSAVSFGAVSFGQAPIPPLGKAAAFVPELQKIVQQFSPWATTALTLMFPGITLGLGIALAVGFPMIVKSLGAQVCGTTGQVQNMPQVKRNANLLIKQVVRTLGKPLTWLPASWRGKAWGWEKPLQKGASQVLHLLKRHGLGYLEQSGAKTLLQAVPKSTLGRIGYFSRWLALGLHMIIGHRLKKLALIGPMLAMGLHWLSHSNGRNAAHNVVHQAFNLPSATSSATAMPNEASSVTSGFNPLAGTPLGNTPLAGAVNQGLDGLTNHLTSRLPKWAQWLIGLFRKP